MKEEIIVIHEDTTQFFGAFSFSAPIVIDDLATRYKELLPSIQSKEMEDLKVEIYIALIPHIKQELLKIGISHSELDEGFSISYDVVDYLLEKWEIKYYSNINLIKNNLKGAKKNSFYGYFFTYFKSIFYQKWNYSKDFNGNTIKRSKTTDLEVKTACSKIDKRVNISRKNKDIMKADIIQKHNVEVATTHLESGEMEFLDEDNFEGKFILMEHLRSNYSPIEIECMLYLAKINCGNLNDLVKRLGMSREKVNMAIKDTKYKAERDKVLFELWESGLC